MANQMIALGVRGPQLPNLAGAAAQYGNMMANMAKMNDFRLEQADAASIRQIMGDPSFSPTDANSLQKLIAIGPAGVEAAKQVVSAQKLKTDLSGAQQQQAEKRVSLVGSGLIGLLRDPSDATLAQTAQTFKAVGMDPTEYEGVLAQISKIPDANQRKLFALQFISQSPNAQNALKFVAPDIKPEKVGDASVFIDNNANSPTFGQELFRITASPAPVKLNQQVVENTLYNVNPVTGVAQEAPVGNATQGLVQGPRTLTRTDTGVVSPYAVSGAPAAAVPAAGFATPGVQTPAAAATSAPSGRTNIPSGRTGGGKITVDAIRPAIVAQESGGNYTLTSPKGALGAYQIMPATGKSLAIRLGLPWRPELMTANTPEAKQYQDALGTAAIEEAVRVGGGDLATTAAYYHGGSDRSKWGPKTRQYVQDIQNRLSGNEPPRGSAGTAPAPTGTAPLTVAEANKRKAFAQILPIIGYNPETGKDHVSDLIAASTSGGAEMLGSNVVGFFGQATPGREALAQLRTIADNMTFEKLRGKLGAQISNADVQLIANTMADIANGNTPANERAAAWNNVVLPLLLRGAGVEPRASATKAAPKAAPRTKRGATVSNW